MSGMRIKALVNKCPCQFQFYYFFIQDQIQSPVTVQLLLVNKVNRLEDFGKVDQANARVHIATQARDKMANANIQYVVIVARYFLICVSHKQDEVSKLCVIYT